MTLTTAVLLCAAVSSAGAGPGPGSVGEARVTLDGQRAALELSGGSPVFRVEAMVRSRLPVAVEQVEIGALCAPSEEDLEAVNAPAVLAAGGSSGSVGVIHRRAEVRLPPGGAVPVRVESPFSGKRPPRAFAVYLLGYRLGRPDPALLLELLHTRVAADERAAVETLALSGNARAKLAVRARWGGRAELVSALSAVAAERPPSKISTAATLDRVFAIRALGVLGGETAERALRGLLSNRWMGAFDGALLAIATERLRGTPLQTPLAFAVPPTAVRMSDLVAAALEDLSLAGERDGSPAAPDAGLEASAAGVRTRVPVGIAGDVISPPASAGSSGDVISPPAAAGTTGAAGAARSTGESGAGRPPPVAWGSRQAVALGIVAVVAGIGAGVLLVRRSRRRR